MIEIYDLPERLLAYLRKTGVAIALSETTGDAPLMFVNDGFRQLTGYDEADVLGQNCRFLQGKGTTDAERAALRGFVLGQGSDSGRFPVVNYRKDGTGFHNYVFMTRIRDGSGAARLILASQFDMTSALQRSRLARNDQELGQVLIDLQQIGRDYGLAMMSSAQQLAESVAIVARLSLRDVSQ